MVRRTLVLRAEESLVTHPEDNISLNHWKTGYLVTYALCEGLALFGLSSAGFGRQPAAERALLFGWIYFVVLLSAATAGQGHEFLVSEATVLSPLRGLFPSLFSSPTARAPSTSSGQAVGCILSPLRGWNACPAPARLRT